MAEKAVVLLSGGMDSATALAIAKNEGFEIYALSFDYGQRNSLEIKKAEKLAARIGVKNHLVMPVHLEKIGGSSLTSDGINVPRGRDLSEIGKEIPSTYVPARNTIFLSYGLAWPKFWRLATYLSGLIQSITAGTRTLVRNISAHLNEWPTWPRKPV